MVRTDQMWRYVREVKLGHYHQDDKVLTWSKLVKVERSKAQGWDFTLECGCRLQSCFDETEIEVQVIWHDDVVNWGK